MRNLGNVMEQPTCSVEDWQGNQPANRVGQRCLTARIKPAGMEREAINNNDVSIESEEEKGEENGWHTKYSFLRLMADDDSIEWWRQEPVWWPR